LTKYIQANGEGSWRTLPKNAGTKIINATTIISASTIYFSRYIFVGCDLPTIIIVQGLLECGKSCRLRWINYLRADIKRCDIYVEEEKENTIFKLHTSLGNKLVSRSFSCSFLRLIQFVQFAHVQCCIL